MKKVRKKKNPTYRWGYEYDRTKKVAPSWCRNNGFEVNPKNIEHAIDEMLGEEEKYSLRPNPQGPRLAKAYKELFDFVRGTSNERAIKESQYLTADQAEKKRQEFEAAWQHLSWIYMKSIAGITHNMMVYPKGAKEEDLFTVEIRRYMYQYITTIMAKCIQLAFNVTRDQMTEYVTKALDLDDDSVNYEILKGTSGHKMFMKSLIKQLDQVMAPCQNIGAKLMALPSVRANPRRKYKRKKKAPSRKRMRLKKSR
jgi:hypothetical protein